MKKIYLGFIFLNLATTLAYAQVSQTVEFKAAKFIGDYTLKESCELGDKGTKVKMTFFHNQVKGEASASYLNVEAYGSQVRGVDIPISSGWAYNEGSFYGDFAHYQLNHSDWVKFGSNERLVVEQRLHLFKKKELVKNRFRIENLDKKTVKIEADYQNVNGFHSVLCEFILR